MEHSSPKIYTEFLPISRADMEARGWEQLDFVVVGGDAYVDHPSFGTAIISRLLEAEGYKVGVLAQPPLHRLRGLQAVRQAEVRLFHRRRQRGQHGQPLFRGKDPPRRGRILPRRQGRRPPGPQRHRVHPPCKAGLPRPAGDLRRSGSFCAVCPLRLLAGHRAAQYRRGLRRGHHQLWHGRTPDRGDRPPPGRRGSRWRPSRTWTAPAT